MKKNSFKAVIFDLDGVLVDTVPLHFKAWKRMFGDYGKEFSFQDYKQKVDGIPRLDGARAILAELNDEELKRASDKKQNYYLKLLNSQKIPVYESSIDFTKELKANNIKIAVISSSKNCHYILEKIGVLSLLDAEVNGNDIIKGKPDPGIFLLAAEKMKVSAAGCIVFEDAVLGVEAARAAGMFCVGVDRYKNPQRLKQADKVIGDLSEINLQRLKEWVAK